MTAQLQSALVAGDRFVIRFSVQIALALNIFIQVPNQEIGDGAFVPVHDKVSGDGFPRLQPGVNTISWVGTVTSLVVQPRWVTL